jgi:hypothetical protein
VPLVAFSAGYIAVAVGLVVWTHRLSADVALYVAGATTTGLAWLVWSLVTEFDGQRSRFAGATAEADSSRELRRLQRDGWVIVDDVEFERFNVDHVLVGPGGIFAIETKWTTQPWTVTHGRLAAGRLGDPARQARAGAEKIATLLRHHARLDTSVEAAIMVWGPGRPSNGYGTPVQDDVVLLDGRSCRRYFRSLSARLPAPEVELAAEALHAFVVERERYDRRRLSGARGARTRGTRGRATGGC